jgi:hypothetical protein
MTPRPRARAAGAEDRLIHAPGGEVICCRRSRAGPVGPCAVFTREIQEGGIRALSGGTPRFPLSRPRRFMPFL